MVEDAAQAHGATYAGKPAGSFADAACWSLYASKNITTGEGGLVTTNNDQIDETLRMIRTHGEKAKYASLILGNNYRMSEMQAAIGNVQLEKLPSFLAKRRRNAHQLTKLLEKSSRLVLPYESKDRLHSWYLYTARIEGWYRGGAQQDFGGTQEKGNRRRSLLRQPCSSDAVLPGKLWKRSNCLKQTKRQNKFSHCQFTQQSQLNKLIT